MDKKEKVNKSPHQQEFYRTRDLCALLGVSNTRVYQLLREKAFPSVRIGGLIYVKKGDYEKFTSQGYTGVAAKK